MLKQTTDGHLIGDFYFVYLYCNSIMPTAESINYYVNILYITKVIRHFVRLYSNLHRNCPVCMSPIGKLNW